MEADITLNKIREESGVSATDWMLYGDQWLLENGIISDVTKNNIVINLYTNFPAKYVEYFLDPTNKTIEIHLFFGRFRYMFYNVEKLSEKCRTLIQQYLKDYTVTTKKRLYER